MTAQTQQDSPLVIAGRTFKSRLIIGTGKYETYEQNARALEASGAEMITVAVRRVNLSDPSQPRLVDFNGQELATIALAPSPPAIF